MNRKKKTMELIKFVSTDNIELNGILYKSENAKNKKIIFKLNLKLII